MAAARARSTAPSGNGASTPATAAGFERGQRVAAIPAAEPRQAPWLRGRRQHLPDALPHLEPVALVARWRLDRPDEPERARQLAVLGGACRALLEMPIDACGVSRLIVEAKNQFLVRQMSRHAHSTTTLVVSRSGSRRARSFRTARKTPCFAALVPTSRMRQISLMDRPS